MSNTGTRLFAGMALLLCLFGCGGGGGGGTPATRAGKIVFASTRGGNADIYLMDDDGSNVARLTTSPGVDMTPSLSWDERRIVYASRRDTAYDLYIMNADGTGKVRVTDTPDADETQPDISPDGRTVVFTRAGSIYAVNIDGSGERRLTNSPGNSDNASFSSRGDKLVFESDRAGSGKQIYVMNADGSRQRAVTNDSGSNTDARFSPDGSQIVYASRRPPEDAANSGIYVMNADGTNARRLVASGALSDGQPTFSPDGRSVVFSSIQSDNMGSLYSIRTDGTALTRLTNAQGVDAFPCWR